MTRNVRTRELQARGQRLWLNELSRPLLTSGTLAHYITDLSVTGVVSNPQLFDQATGASDAYDDAIQVLAATGMSADDIRFELALEDLTQAAEYVRPVFDATSGDDGWVSPELSPLLANDMDGMIRATAKLNARTQIANLLIQIPGTTAGVRALEELIFAGIPVNVTLLFSREHYLAAAQAYMRGIERRVAEGLTPVVKSVASMSISPWDIAVSENMASPFHDRLGIAVAMRTFKAYCDLLASSRWQKLEAAGAHPQQLVWASTGVADSLARDTLYVEALLAVGTTATIPEKTLLAFADHGSISRPLPVDGGYADIVLAEFRREGLDDKALATRLQLSGLDEYVTSWEATLGRIREKCSTAIAVYLT